MLFRSRPTVAKDWDEWMPTLALRRHHTMSNVLSYDEALLEAQICLVNDELDKVREGLRISLFGQKNVVTSVTLKQLRRLDDMALNERMCSLHDEREKLQERLDDARYRSQAQYC